MEDQDPLPTGTVTAIKIQRRDSSRRSVFLDGAFAFGVDAELCARFGLVVGAVVDEAQAHALRRAEALVTAKQWALNQLAYRPRSVFEIRRFLLKKQVEESVVDEVVNRFLEIGYLDDEAFAAAYASSARGSRNLGPRRIVADLRKRGISQDLAERTAGEGPDANDAALHHASRYMSRLQGESDHAKRHRKMYAHLARRGFEPETIRQVIRVVLPDTDDA